jgi:hypothetical protein
MPVTALRIKEKDKTIYLQVETQPDPDVEGQIVVVFRRMDNTYQVSDGADQGVDNRTEEEYHTALRKEAAEKNQLITSHSTDPEWNPEGYVEIINRNGSM